MVYRIKVDTGAGDDNPDPILLDVTDTDSWKNLHETVAGLIDDFHDSGPGTTVTIEAVG